VCDLDELATGKRREGIFGAIYWWMVKLGFAVAGLLSGAIMSLVAFTPGAAVQPAGAVDGLRLFYSGVPILGTMLAMWIMRDYDLDEKRAMEVNAELQRRKQPAAPASSQVSGGRPHLKTPRLDLSDAPVSRLAGQSPHQIAALFSQTRTAGLHGLCFSPYVEGQRIGDLLSEAQIRRRIGIVAPYTQWVRSFSCTEGHELIPALARAQGLKTMVGAWIGQDRERNEREISSLIKLAAEGLVDIATVGNEVMLRNDLPEEELLVYIRRVKAAVPGNVPVGCVDAYSEFLDRPALTQASDLMLPNCYPFWEGVDITQAPHYLKHMYALVRNVAGGKKVVIAETGWPGQGQTVSAALPSPENAMRYFIETQDWARSEGVDLFYFSSFDEAWKVGAEGDVGANWGLWDKDGKPKFV
jgi:GPH family glycoside/pentoside/hexuronide:cation symporter